MKWYEVKERSAGEKRLILTYYIYKYFGKFPLVVIAFFVALATFLAGKDLREYSRKYLDVVGVKPNNFNIFRHFLSYALSLADKIEVFSGKFDKKNIKTENICPEFLQYRANNKGAVCIFSHVGNIDVARVLIGEEQKITILLSLEQAKIFRDFLGKISNFKNINLVAVEQIGIETVIELKDRVEKGEFIFIAGDRTSKNNRNIEVNVLGQRVDFPLGSYKLAELLETDVFFVACLKEKHGYDMKVEISNQNDAKQTAHSFAEFVSKLAQAKPFQFYHFYDFFKTKIE